MLVWSVEELSEKAIQRKKVSVEKERKFWQ